MKCSGENDDPVLDEINKENRKRGIRFIVQGSGAIIFLLFISIRYQYAFQNNLHTKAAAGTIGIAIFLLLFGITSIGLGFVLILKKHRIDNKSK